jgi:flagellar hook-length control protein FliK
MTNPARPVLPAFSASTPDLRLPSAGTGAGDAFDQALLALVAGQAANGEPGVFRAVAGDGTESPDGDTASAPANAAGDAAASWLAALAPALLAAPPAAGEPPADEASPVRIGEVLPPAGFVRADHAADDAAPAEVAGTARVVVPSGERVAANPPPFTTGVPVASPVAPDADVPAALDGPPAPASRPGFAKADPGVAFTIPRQAIDPASPPRANPTDRRAADAPAPGITNPAIGARPARAPAQMPAGIGASVAAAAPVRNPALRPATPAAQPRASGAVPIAGDETRVPSPVALAVRTALGDPQPPVGLHAFAGRPVADTAPDVPRERTPDAAPASAVMASIASASPPALAPAAAQGAAPPLAEPLGSPAWREGLGERVKLAIREGRQEATVALHPADLGPIEVRVRIEHGTASLAFDAARVETRQAIEDALPRLREMLEGGGIAMGETSVGHRGAGAEWLARPESAPRAPMAPAAAAVPAPATRPVAAHSRGGVDTFA